MSKPLDIKTFVTPDGAFASVHIDGAGLTFVSINRIHAESTVAVAQQDSGANVWVGLEVDGRFYGLVIWKHTVGRPELDVAVKQAAAEVEAAIASLAPTFDAWCQRFTVQDAAYNAQTAAATKDWRSAAHWRMVAQRLQGLASAEPVAVVTGDPAAALSPLTVETAAVVATARGAALGLDEGVHLEPGAPVIVATFPHSGAAGEVVDGPDAAGYYAVQLRVDGQAETWRLLPEELRPVA